MLSSAIGARQADTLARIACAVRLAMHADKDSFNEIMIGLELGARNTSELDAQIEQIKKDQEKIGKLSKMNFGVELMSKETIDELRGKR